MKQRGKQVTVAFKVDRKLALRLERLAKRNDRSMGAELRLMMAERLAERENGAKR